MWITAPGAPSVCASSNPVQSPSAEWQVASGKGHSKTKTTDPGVYLTSSRGTNQPQILVLEKKIVRAWVFFGKGKGQGESKNIMHMCHRVFAKSPYRGPIQNVFLKKSTKISMSVIQCQFVLGFFVLSRLWGFLSDESSKFKNTTKKRFTKESRRKVL
jgi:hypothetical protein